MQATGERGRMRAPRAKRAQACPVLMRDKCRSVRAAPALPYATPLPRFCRHSTLLSGNTPTYAAIPSENVRKAIREVPQNIGNLARMAVGKLAKAAEKKTVLTPVSTASLHGVFGARSHHTYRGLEGPDPSRRTAFHRLHAGV